MLCINLSAGFCFGAAASTISLLRGSDVKKVQWTFDSAAENKRQKTAMFIVLVDVLMKTFFEEACHGCSDFRWRVADHLLKEDFHGEETAEGTVSINSQISVNSLKSMFVGSDTINEGFITFK